ncbi:MAG: hypothetical protein M0P55_14535 [Clostridiales bacterium]|nr:hypothetical protein [Clostridiales bacterium]
MSAELGSYKGHPTITLKEDPRDQHGITFGIVKAHLIVKHLAGIWRD